MLQAASSQTAPRYNVRFPLYAAAAYLLLPLMWLNITTGENRWEVLGIGVGQIVYWVMIGLGWYIAYRSPYWLVATVMLAVAVSSRLVEFGGGGEAAYAIRVAALAVIFIIVGASIYGRNPFLLHKQLVVFLGLCAVIMILQILGVSSLLMGWNTGYAHDLSILDMDEIGTFKEVPLYPVLFVEIDELQYSIGQGRPVGLMHSSNILSIFVAAALVLNLGIPRTSSVRVSDIVLTVVAVLTMSKMVFVIAILAYACTFLFGARAKKRLAMKLTISFAMATLLYYFLFPGLFVANFSEEMIWTSILLRLLGIMHVIGIERYAFFYDQQQLIGAIYREEESYSAVALLFKSDMLVPAIALMLLVSLVYAFRVWQMQAWPAMMYVVILLVCVATQFAVPFALAPSFQLIAGFGLFPLFRKLWYPSSARRHLWIRWLVGKPTTTPGSPVAGAIRANVNPAS